MVEARVLGELNVRVQPADVNLSAVQVHRHRLLRIAHRDKRVAEVTPPGIYSMTMTEECCTR